MNIDFNKYFNLENLPPEDQQLLIGAITDLVLARMAAMIGEHLTAQEIVELEAIGQGNDDRALMEWLNTHIPNFTQGLNELLAEESRDLAQKVSALTDYALQAIYYATRSPSSNTNRRNTRKARPIFRPGRCFS